jgi:hypothetical protein
LQPGRRRRLQTYATEFCNSAFSWQELRAKLANKGEDLHHARGQYTTLDTLYETKRAEADQLAAPLTERKHQMRRLERQLHDAQVAKLAAKGNIKEWRATNARDLLALVEGVGERVNDEQGRTSEELKTVSWGLKRRKRHRGVVHLLCISAPNARTRLTMPQRPTALSLTRPPSPHAAQEMDNLIRRVKKAEKKHGGKNLHELQAQATLMNTKMMEKKEELTVVTKSREGTQAAFEERYKFWQRSCKHKGKQANLDFNGRLTRKGHAGELRFDHRTQTLSLQVRRFCSSSSPSYAHELLMLHESDSGTLVLAHIG